MEAQRQLYNVLFFKEVESTFQTSFFRQLEGLSLLDGITVKQAQRQPKIYGEKDRTFCPVLLPVLKHGLKVLRACLQGVVLHNDKAESPTLPLKMPLKSPISIHEPHLPITLSSK